MTDARIYRVIAPVTERRICVENTRRHVGQAKQLDNDDDRLI